MKKFFPLLMLSVTLTGCATLTDAQKQQQMANAPLVAAGLITPAMATDMAIDDADKIQHLINTSSPQNQQQWKNNITHDSYRFDSFKISVNSQGQPCRAYQLQAFIGRHDQTLQTTACRQDDGAWQAINNSAAPAQS